MKKIPTLFERIFENHKIVGITDKVTPGLEWVLQGEGVATVKIDGSCTAIINGEFFKRYDARKGKKAPDGAIPCCEPDPITGHHPHWVKVDENSPSDKWFVNAYKNTPEVEDGTYEAIGVHFQGNPYGLCDDILERHGAKKVETPRTFEGIKQYLADHNIEGIVFWKDGEPRCKIKRSDFGYTWGRENDMARYIDADALYKKLYPLDSVDKRFYTINAKAVADAIAKIPTADVVPIVELDAMRGAANSYKMHYENAKAEVAREIFEEIDRGIAEQYPIYSAESIRKLLAELKKKYTEDK